MTNNDLSLKSELQRRRFLRSALTAGAITVGAGPLGLNALAAERTNIFAPAKRYLQNTETRRLAPVKVARNRVIREVVGLRPYRPGGFVVEAETVGAKLLVHNYGHGGAGVTLSWGTASQAVDLARDFIQTRTHAASPARPPSPRGQRRTRTQPRRFAVLGCGVSGLSTARLLQRRFQNGAGSVTIYAKNLPPETTSNIAGAWWYPASVFEQEAATARFSEQFRLACQISNKAFQTLVGTEYGVRWTETYELMRNESSLTRELFGGAQLYPQTEAHRDPQRFFGFPFVRQFSTMLIEPHVYLSALLRDFYIAGGKVVVTEFQSREEIARLAEPVIFNCTGLGARALFHDQALIPVRGQLEVLLPQPEVDYCYLSGSGYMFPRRDGIILGGTWDHDDWSLEPDPEQTNQILAGHTEIMRAAAR